AIPRRLPRGRGNRVGPQDADLPRRNRLRVLLVRLQPALPGEVEPADPAPGPDRKPGSADQAVQVLAADRENRGLTKLFGFAQLDSAGALPLADGRYLARGNDPAEGESVLVVRALSTAPAPGRRRRRPRQADPESGPSTLPLTRVTAVRAF